MVQPKNKPSIREELLRATERTVIVDEKWAVEEVTPGYDTGGYYSQYVSEHSERVSPFFETPEESFSWMDEHEADNGKFLTVVHYIGREHKSISWTKVKVKEQ